MSVVVDGIRGFFLHLLSRILLYVKYTFIVLEVRSGRLCYSNWVSGFDTVLILVGCVYFSPSR